LHEGNFYRKLTVVTGNELVSVVVLKSVYVMKTFIFIDNSLQ